MALVKIVNPIYDLVFKYLMDNDRLAKKIISSVIGSEVLSLDLQANDATFVDESRDLRLVRYDFKARILTPEGEQAILIEVQKSNRIDPIIRFRKYLGQAYMNKEQRKLADGSLEDYALPIISIYFLGYTMPQYPYRALLVDNAVINLLNGTPIPEKNDFVRMLTHRCYILQPYTPPTDELVRPSALNRLLDLFYKVRTASKMQIIEIDDAPFEDEPDLKEMIRSLHRLTQNNEVLRNMDIEEEWLRELDKRDQRILNSEKELKEAIVEKEEALKNEAIALEKVSIALQKEAESRQALINTVRAFAATGATKEKIAEITKLSEEEIRRILG